MKGHYKLEVCSTRTAAPRRDHDISDLTHISLEAMFLTISKVHSNDYDLCIQKCTFVAYKTSEGYQTAESMIGYLNQIVNDFGAGTIMASC
jgi:hypothetical protein